MTADLSIFVQDQIARQASLFLVGRQTSFGHSVVPAKPYLAIPVILDNACLLVKQSLTEGLTAVLRCKAFDFTEDTFFHGGSLTMAGLVSTRSDAKDRFIYDIR